MVSVLSRPWALTGSGGTRHCPKPCMRMNPLTPHSQRGTGMTLVPVSHTRKLRLRAGLPASAPRASCADVASADVASPSARRPLCQPPFSKLT